MPSAKFVFVLTTLVWTAAALRIAAPELQDTVQPMLVNTIGQGTTQSESEAVFAQRAALENYEDMQLETAMKEVGPHMHSDGTIPRVGHKSFMFLQPPHTATMTVQTALSVAIGQRVPHSHNLLANRIKNLPGEEGIWKAFDSTISFAFVRNPWERVLSCAGWLGKIDGSHSDRNLTKEEDIQNFREFVVHNLGKRRFISNGLCAYLGQQVDWVYAKRPNEPEARSQLTFVGNTNNLQEDFYKVCDLIGVPRLDIKSVAQHCVSSCSETTGKSTHVDSQAKRRHRDYREYYDDETQHIVSRLMAKDIKAFGFKYGQ